MIRGLRSGMAAVAVVACATVLSSCQLDVTEPIAVEANAWFAAQASSCAVEINFPHGIPLPPAMEPSYYRVEGGEQAVLVEEIVDTLSVYVTFPSALVVGDRIEVGPREEMDLVVEIQQNDLDETPPLLTGARFIEDAQQPIVVLSFDDALDPAVAADVIAYSFAGTIDHPVSAEVGDCGREVVLVFDALSTSTKLDVDSLTDVNGVGFAQDLNNSIAVADEENRPEVTSVAYVADAPEASIAVTFNEVVDQKSAETVANYLLSPLGVQPTTATVQAGGMVVVLTFEPFDPPLTLDVSEITDLSGNPMIALTDLEVETPADNTAPSAMTARAIGQDGGIGIYLEFSEAIVPATALRLENYVLRNRSESSGIAPTSVALVEGGIAVELSFAFLPTDAVLEVSGHRDPSGNSMAEPMTVELGAPQDSIGPQIVTAAFVADQTVPTVDVVFDRVLERDSAEEATNYEFSTAGSALGASLQDDFRTVRLTVGPVGRLETLTAVGVVDTEGATMTEVSGVAIAPGLDQVVPEVTSATFTSSSQTPTVVLEFSEAVDRTLAETVASYTTSLESSSPNTAVLQNDGRTVVLEFGPLSGSTTILVDGVTDLSGVAVDPDGPEEIASAPDTILPAIESARFVTDASAPTVDVVFSEAVDETRASTSGLYRANVARISPTSAVVQDDGRTVRLVFSSIQYEDSLDVRSVTDLNGNVMRTVAALAISRSSDGDVPYIVSATFASGATTPTVNVVFSEAVDEDTSETLTNYGVGDSATLPTSAVLQPNHQTVQLQFARLTASSWLSVGNIRDFGGNIMAGVSELVIARHSETTAPTVSSATVTATTQVTIVFSEAVDQQTAESVSSYEGFPRSIYAFSAALQADGRTVIVTVKGNTILVGDKMDIRNVMDLNGNVMVSVADKVLE